MTSTFQIELDNHGNRFHRKYRPKDTIAGKVACIFPIPTIVKDVRVELVGEEKTQWSKFDNVNNENNSDDNSTNTVTFKGYHQFLSMEKSSLEGTSETTTYDFDFSFELPENIPSSFKNERGWVKFFIKATADIEPYTGDTLAIEYIEVVSPIRNRDFTSIDTINKPYNQSVKKLFPSAIGTNAITMDMHLTKRAFVQGEQIPIMLDIKNTSNEKIDKIEVVLGQTIHSKVETPEGGSRFDHETISRAASGGVKSNENDLIEIILRIPKSASIPNFTGCKLFELKCWIDVKAVIREDLNVNLSTWVLIGQIGASMETGTSPLPSRSCSLTRSHLGGPNTRHLPSKGSTHYSSKHSLLPTKPAPSIRDITTPMASSSFSNQELPQGSQMQQAWNDIHGSTYDPPSINANPIPNDVDTVRSAGFYQIVPRERPLSVEDQLWNEFHAIITQAAPPSNNSDIRPLLRHAPQTREAPPPYRDWSGSVTAHRNVPQDTILRDQVWREMHAIITQAPPSNDVISVPSAPFCLENNRVIERGDSSTEVGGVRRAPRPSEAPPPLRDWTGSVAPPDSAFVARPRLSSSIRALDDDLSNLLLDAEQISPPPCYEDVVWGENTSTITRRTQTARVAMPSVVFSHIPEDNPPTYEDVIWEEIHSKVTGTPRSSRRDHLQESVSAPTAPVEDYAASAPPAPMQDEATSAHTRGQIADRDAGTNIPAVSEYVVGHASYPPVAPPQTCHSIGFTAMPRPLPLFSGLEMPTATSTVLPSLYPHPSDSLSTLEPESTVDSHFMRMPMPSLEMFSPPRGSSDGSDIMPRPLDSSPLVVSREIGFSVVENAVSVSEPASMASIESNA